MRLMAILSENVFDDFEQAKRLRCLMQYLFLDI